MTVPLEPSFNPGEQPEGAAYGVSPSAIVGPGVKLGPEVYIGPGAIVVGHCEIGAGCRIESGAVLDPSSDGSNRPIVLEPSVRVMPGATIASGVLVATGAVIEAGTVVQRDVPPHAVVSGNPAQISGYTDSQGTQAREGRGGQAREPGVTTSRVRGVTLHHLPRILDLRGNLTVGEFGRSIPFEARRYFMVFGVPNAEIRGEHAHRTCEQFLICAQGSCSVVADDGQDREEFLLDDPALGLYLPALTWGVQYKYSSDAVLLVFASEYYSSEEYIRDYAEFVALAADA